MAQYERNVGIHQRNPFKFRHNITQLCLIGFQELPAGRHVKKQVLHREITAPLTCHRFLLLHLRTSNLDIRTQAVLLAAGFQLHLCHSRNGSQRLAPEPHGMQGEQIGRFPDFRGSMTLKSHSGIRFRHALPVVNYPYAGFPGIGHQYLDVLGTGIDSVFHQLFNDRRRTLYHLTGCNLVGYRIRQQTDYISRGHNVNSPVIR